MKHCNFCHRDLPFDQFSLRADGRQNGARCRTCRAEYQRSRPRTAESRRLVSDKAREGHRRRNARYCASGKHALASSAWYYQNKERYRESRRRYLKSAKGKAMLARQTATRRAAKLGVVSTLTAEEWQEILRVYEGICAYCDQPGTTMDHVVPMSLGGAHAAHNVVPACRPCNCSKRDRLWIPRIPEPRKPAHSHAEKGK